MMGWYQDYLQANAVAVYYSPTKNYHALLVDCAGEEILEKIEPVPPPPMASQERQRPSLELHKTHYVVVV